MKSIVATLLFFGSAVCLAKPMSMELSVPEGAKYAYVTIQDVSVDMCNQYGLRAGQMHEGLKGHYTLDFSATDKYCRNVGKKVINLWADIILERYFTTNQTMTLHFDSDLVDKLKVEFR